VVKKKIILVKISIAQMDYVLGVKNAYQNTKKNILKRMKRNLKKINRNIT
jgi:hypothetical protein